MKRIRLHAVFAVLFLAALIYDFWLWGGLSLHPQLGTYTVPATVRELAIASIYAPAGVRALRLTGLGQQAAEHAGALFAPLLPRLESNPQAAMETLVADMPLQARIAYYGAPLSLVAFLLAYWRRPRDISLIRRR